MRHSLTALLLLVSAANAQVPFVNWEVIPVEPLALSPDGRHLALAHTADERLLWYDLSGPEPALVGQLRVGLNPVSVRFRNASEVWVVNHISDSISVVDLDARRVVRTIQTADEPFDLVFAGQPTRAYVSCSQANQVQVFNLDGSLATTIAIDAEEPRAMAVSADGRFVYSAIFESGNGTTILAGGAVRGGFPPNVVTLPGTPYGGQTPPPNTDQGIDPPLAAGLPTPPDSGLIVRKQADGTWRDGNNADWTDWVSGSQAADAGRVAGWDLPDRDIAIIDTQSNAVSYATGLMNIVMDVSVHPTTGELHAVGTDARNEVRFEPVLRGNFLRVNSAIAVGSGPARAVHDLNPHLDYTGDGDAQLRARSLGDPRAIVWQSDGQRAYVSGMGSNNLIVLDASGVRDTAVGPIGVGQGATGLALDETRNRLYVWNHFDATLSVVDSQSLTQTASVGVFNPLPRAIRDGRAHFYDTHENSAYGHVACASCHVDGRMDRLAWDLGDPQGELKTFNQNCVTRIVSGKCDNFHPVKGPMTTQTLQDIIGHEPLHWRGDRDGIEEFNPAFMVLQGGEAMLSATEMQQFENYLATLHFPPNPFRSLNNQLPLTVNTGEVSHGRFSPAGTPLPNGDAQAGLTAFRTSLLVDVGQGLTDQCTSCHTLPTGMAVNGPMFASNGTELGGAVQPIGPNGEDHLGVTSNGTVSGGTFKIAQLRSLYEKVGFDMSAGGSQAGFGFLHDGSVDTLSRFVTLEDFLVESDQQVANVIAFLLAFSGSDLPTSSVHQNVATPGSQDTHAGVGRQFTLTSGSVPGDLTLLISEARDQRVGLVASRGTRSWYFDNAKQGFVDSPSAQASTLASLLAVNDNLPLTVTAVPNGLGARLGTDQDGDGVSDAAEVDQGSSPIDAALTTLQPAQGLWWNPDRNGHGIDLQLAGDLLAATWYSYREDGTPIWYQAVADLTVPSWSAELSSFTWTPAGGPVGTAVGTIGFEFTDRNNATLSWTVNGESGSEPFQRFAFDQEFRAANYTGLWYDPSESGWGLTVDSRGNTRVAVMYFYDDDGEPLWTLGVSPNAASAPMPMDSFTGFCPNCPTVAPQATAAGTLTLSFADLRSVEVDTEILNWIRNDSAMVPLTTPALDLSPYQ